MRPQNIGHQVSKRKVRIVPVVHHHAGAMANNLLQSGQLWLHLNNLLRHPRHRGISRIKHAGRAHITIVRKSAQRLCNILCSNVLHAAAMPVHTHNPPLKIGLLGLQFTHPRKHGGHNKDSPKDIPNVRVFYFCFSHFQRSAKVDFLPYIRIPTL